MIELTAEQRQELEGPAPVRVRDPQTDETYVLVRADDYERIKDLLYDYDDSPWTDEEMDMLAWEAGQMAGWDDMSEYDSYEKPA
jgi:hypothetical protein